MRLVGGQIRLFPAANPRQIADQLFQRCRHRLPNRRGRTENSEQGVRVRRQQLRMPWTHTSLAQFNFNRLIAHGGNLPFPWGFANLFRRRRALTLMELLVYPAIFHLWRARRLD